MCLRMWNVYAALHQFLLVDFRHVNRKKPQTEGDDSDHFTECPAAAIDREANRGCLLVRLCSGIL